MHHCSSGFVAVQLGGSCRITVVLAVLESFMKPVMSSISLGSTAMSSWLSLGDVPSYNGDLLGDVGSSVLVVTTSRESPTQTK